MPIYNLLEYSDNYSKASGNSDVKIVFPLKYLSNFWKALEMPLINYEKISF